VPLTREMIDAMVEAKLTPEQMAVLLKAEVAAAEAKREAKRANNAERQQRHRDKRKAERNDRNALCGVTERDTPKTKVPPTPPSKTQTPSNPPSPPTGAQTPTGVSAKRGLALPLDWKPKDRHFAKAGEAGLDRDFVLSEAEGMREWADGNSNRAVARKADWDRTFDGWLRRSIPGAVKTTGPPMNGHHSPFALNSNVSRRYAEPTRKPRSVHDAARDLELWAADVPQRGRH
jgi:hypothetical protein